MSMSTSLREAETSHTTPIKSSTERILDLPPSCLEFSSDCDKYFVVGTYHLQPENYNAGKIETVQARSGSLILFHLEARGLVLSLLQTIATEFAVLDLHFSAHEQNLFAIGTSTGSICLYVIESDHENNISLRRLSCLQIADPSILVLSISWSPSSRTPTTLAYSLSSGQIGIFDYKSFRSSSRTSEAHSSEAWTIAWSAMSSIEDPTLYSGGDDSALCRHLEVIPLRSIQHPGQSMSKSIIRDVKAHGAGVTAILPIAIELGSEEVVLTGSYDEFIRVLTLKTPSGRAQVLCEKRLGGGVWRLKYLGCDRPALNGKLKIEVLASCMHAGTRVVQICRSEEYLWVINIVARFEEHESMNYASDARRQELEKDSSSTTYVSTSFYDKKLCVWNLKDGKTR